MIIRLPSCQDEVLWGKWNLVKSLSIVMISLTERGHGDSLGTVNGGGDGFTDSSRSHGKSLLPLFCW
jgi:hypothetical protein